MDLILLLEQSQVFSEKCKLNLSLGWKQIVNDGYEFL